MPKGSDTRNLIIRTAARLINESGYRGCSMSAIIEETKLKKGGIYNHFRKKDEIALAAFDYNFKNFIKAFRRRLDQDQTPTQKIKSVIEVYAHLISLPDFKAGCPIFNTVVDASNIPQELVDRAREAVEQLKTYLEIKMQEGIESGEFRSGADKTAIASMIIMTLEGALIMARINGPACIQMAVEGLDTYLKQKLYKV